MASAATQVLIFVLDAAMSSPSALLDRKREGWGGWWLTVSGWSQAMCVGLPHGVAVQQGWQSLYVAYVMIRIHVTSSIGARLHRNQSVHADA